MTKLEEKLIELGYEKSFPYGYFKKYLKGKRCIITIIANYELDEIIETYIEKISHTRNQQDIDNLQQAYNQLQKDLEVK